MFSAHFQIMPKFDNMVLSDLVLFKDGMYFIYSLTETLSNYRDYRINNQRPKWPESRLALHWLKILLVMFVNI